MDKHRDTILYIITQALLLEMQSMDLDISETHCEVLARTLHKGLVCSGYEIMAAPKPKKTT